MSGNRRDRRAVHSAPYTFNQSQTPTPPDADIPASLHALDFAYNDLKKRYNELNHKNSMLMKHLQQSPQPGDANLTEDMYASTSINPQPSTDIHKVCQEEKQRDFEKLGSLQQRLSSLEQHNEDLLKENAILKQRLKQEKSQTDRLKTILQENEHHQQALLSKIERDKNLGKPSDNDQMAAGLSQLLQLVHNQRSEMAALRQLADKQRLAIEQMLISQPQLPAATIDQDLMLDIGPQSVPTQCTESQAHHNVPTENDCHSHNVQPSLQIHTEPTTDGICSPPWSPDTTQQKLPLVCDPDPRMHVKEGCLAQRGASLSEDGETSPPPPPSYDLLRANNHLRLADFDHPRPLNYERNLEPARPSNTQVNVNLHTEPVTPPTPPLVLNNHPLAGHKPSPAPKNLYPPTCPDFPREAADGSAENSLSPQVCPICNTDFSPPLSLANFQSHVNDCLPSATSAGEDTSGVTSGRQDSDERVCPMCNEGFPVGVPQADFLQHVDSHFPPDFTMVENDGSQV